MQRDALPWQCLGVRRKLAGCVWLSLPGDRADVTVPSSDARIRLVFPSDVTIAMPRVRAASGRVGSGCQVRDL
jgi:hypothetical protein